MGWKGVAMVWYIVVNCIVVRCSVMWCGVVRHLYRSLERCCGVILCTAVCLGAMWCDVMCCGFGRLCCVCFVMLYGIM